MQRCKESFTVWRDGAPVAYVVGQLVDDEDPILITHEHLFAAPEATVRPAPQAVRAEQATAAPGELRALSAPPATGRPRKGTPRKE
ncbi:hypothetical protein ACIPPM_22120 [Streptomyces sp. NPDC090119]|uniref:hypothetical protein n=1 Tax=Streptomyces sp. NPDC090119 TaxID=3365951 RepID=UPI0037FE68A3